MAVHPVYRLLDCADPDEGETPGNCAFAGELVSYDDDYGADWDGHPRERVSDTEAIVAWLSGEVREHD